MKANSDSVASMRSFLAGHLAYAFAGRSLNMLFTALLSVAAARAFPHAEFRVFSVFLVVTILGGILASFGLGSVVLKRLVEVRSNFGNEATKHFINRLFSIGFMASVAVGIASFCSFLLFGEKILGITPTTQLNICLSVGVFVRGLQTVYTETGRASGNIVIANVWGGVSGGPIYAAGMLAYFLAGAYFSVSLLSAICFSTCLNATITIVAYWLIRQEGISGNSTSTTTFTFASIAGLAIQLCATEFLLNSHGNLDTILTTMIADQEQGAQYIAARRLTQFATIPAVIANVATVGVLARLRLSMDNARLNTLMQAFATAAFLAGLPFAMLLVLAPTFVVTTIYGSGYSEAGQLLQILIIGQMIYIVTGPCMQVLMQTDSCGYSVILSGLAVAILLVCGPFVCHQYGATGLAWLSTVTAVLSNTGGWMLCAWREGLYTHVSIGKLVMFLKSRGNTEATN